MANSNTVTVRFLGDAGPLQKTFKQVGDGAEDTHKRISGMGSKISGVFSTLGAATAAVGIAKFGADSINAFKDAEQASIRLNQAFSKSPALIGANVKEFENLAGALQKKTKFDDEAIKTGDAVLAGFNLTGEQIKELTPLLLDYASRTGKSVPDAATDLGKALLGQGRALKAIGIEFKDTGSTAGNFAELVGGLREKVGGLATKEGKSASGQMAILKNQFGELQEKVGSALVPILTKLANGLLKVVEFFQKLPGPVQIVVGVMVGLSIVLGVLAAAASVLTPVIGALGIAFNILLGPIGLVILAIAALAAIVYLVIKNWDTIAAFFVGIWDKIYSVFSGAVSAISDFISSHWMLIVGILTGGLGLAVAWVIQHWDDIKNAFSAAVSWVGNFLSAAWRPALAILTFGMSEVVGFLARHFDDIVSFFSGLPGRLAAVGSDMWGFLRDAFRGAINWIISAWNHLHFDIPEVDLGPLGSLGGGRIQMPQIPYLAAGGIVRRPTLAMVGENGPEAVVPLGRLNGATTVVINMPHYIGSREEVLELAYREFTKAGGRYSALRN